MDQELKEEIMQMYARFCGGLADPTRIMILYTLAQCPYNVSDLASALGLPQPTVSRHLKVLRERNIVRAQRDGQSVYYTLTDERIIQALDLLRAVIADQLHSRNALAQAAVESPT